MVIKQEKRSGSLIGTTPVREITIDINCSSNGWVAVALSENLRKMASKVEIEIMKWVGTHKRTSAAQELFIEVYIKFISRKDCSFVWKFVPAPPTHDAEIIQQGMLNLDNPNY